MFCSIPGKSDQLYSLINGIDINFFHVVAFRLRHVYSIHTPQFGNAINIMIAPSAEMDCPSMEFIEQELIVRFDVFFLDYGRQNRLLT
jgi:hypothetical protein